MENKCIYLLRDILWKCFWVGFLLTFFFGVIWLTQNEPLSQFATKMIGIDTETYQKLWFEFITYAKIVLFYIYLVPAISLSCICKKCKCKCKEEEI